jgi:hypothetical protein
MPPWAKLLAGCALAAALAGCDPTGDTGYVEIKTVPMSAVSVPQFYLDTVKLDPVKKGVAVLRQRVGTAKLASEGSGGQLSFLCDIVVKKNRITTVTVSVVERPPRCQCRNGGNADRACVS